MEKWDTENSMKIKCHISASHKIFRFQIMLFIHLTLFHAPAQFFTWIEGLSINEFYLRGKLVIKAKLQILLTLFYIFWSYLISILLKQRRLRTIAPSLK